MIIYNNTIVKKIPSLSTILVLFVLAVCCGRQINCPDFDDEILEWIPYQKNDTIKLVNLSNDSAISFVIDEIFVEHTTHYKTNLDCGTCNDYVSITSLNNDLQIEIQLNENDISLQRYVIKDAHFWAGDSDYIHDINHTFMDITYNEVKIFIQSDINAVFTKLILAKGFGIVGLLDGKGHIWVLKPNDTEKTKSITNEIINISCG